MEFAFIFIVGLVFGWVFTSIWWRKKSIGNLRIDTSDPDDNPYLFLELEHGVGDIRRKKYVTLKVNTISYIPRN